MYLLVRYKILGSFVHTMTVDDKYSRHNSENFNQTIQIELSKKAQTFLEISFYSWNLRKFFNIFVKKDEPHSLSIWSTINSKKQGYLNL